jgi:hypothetical protein
MYIVFALQQVSAIQGFILQGILPFRHYFPTSASFYNFQEKIVYIIYSIMPLVTHMRA